MNITAEPLLVTTSVSAGLPATIYAEPFTVHALMGATLSPYIYVVDSGNNRVQAFDYDGNFVFSFGEYGTGDGQFDNPYGITTDNTYLYVTDRGNSRVEVFDMDGVYQYQFGGSGTQAGQFDSPHGIAVDSNYLYVIDTNNNRFQIFTKDGIFLYTYGEFGSGDGQFDHPTDCSIDDYYIYIADTGNDRTVILKKSFALANYIYGFIQPLEANFHLYSNSIKMELELPPLDITLRAIQNGVIKMELELPPLGFSARGGGQVSLGFPALEASFHVITGEASTMNLELPPLEIGLTSHNIEHATMNLELPPLFSTIHLTSGNICTMKLELPPLSAHADMKGGGNAKMELTLPPLSIDTHLATGSLLTMNLEMPVMYINIQGRAIPVSVTYKGIVINTRTGAVTEYNNFNFNSIVEYKGQYLMASENGIYSLTGDKDDGVDIDAHFRTGIIDMNRDIVKRVDEMWFTGRNGVMTLTCTLDEDATLNFDVTPLNNKATSTRLKLPKGIKNRFIDYTVSNKNGSDFEIQSLKLMVNPIRRKVR